MTFNEYQEQSQSTAQQDYHMPTLAYYALGLLGEAGEVSEKIKKLYRDDGGSLSHDRREALAKELGDVLWYLAALAHELKLPLEDVAILNRQKLLDRMKRNVRGGDGDNR